jgi:CheY-like chemotaxis protein
MIDGLSGWPYCVGYPTDNSARVELQYATTFTGLLSERTAGPLRTQEVQVTMGQETPNNVAAVKVVSRRILVADDDLDGAETLAIVLRVAGHDVQIAHDGPSTLRIAADFQPDVVFLDVGMPGMDGFETARQLRQSVQLDRAVLVALTGYGREEDRARAAQAGFDHFFVKPTPPKVLTDIALQLRPSG